nr:hypothetical protein [uncultured Aminipila sp.]
MIRERGSKLYVGYAFGNGSEACIYNFVASFFMIYLTGVAGINAQLAGTITSIALLTETVASINLFFAGNYQCYIKEIDKMIR